MPNEISHGSANSVITNDNWQELLENYLTPLLPAKRILIIPPDHTRLNSRAGDITAWLWQRLSGESEIKILPALGTHFPMTEAQLHMMFGKEIPLDAYLEHRWREDLIQLGHLDSAFISELSEGKLNYEMDVEVNKELFEGYDLILSIGQIVPHEVIGMANYTKNIMIGVGGKDMINKSHFLGAVYDMERIMGKTDSPVRAALNTAYDRYIREELNIKFILTVIGKEQDDLVMRGLYCGESDEMYAEACELSRACNLDRVREPLKKCVVYLDPHEFNSTWLGNKAIYRTRLAMADAGELIILAPALHTLGEDPEIDRLIRKYGYFGTDQTLKDVAENPELAENLSAAAHLIHGTANGRFNITYCPGEEVSQELIESVGYNWASYAEMSAKYDPTKLKDGWNHVDGEEIFYISNPALGLWSL